VKFKNLPDFLEYSDFTIESHEGKHTVCKVLFSIEPDDAENFLYASENRTKIEICSDSEERIMNGIISAVAINYGVTSTTAEVTITSESLLLQEKSEERIFQSPKKTYSDILKSFDEIEIGKCDHLKDVVEEIIYQHNIDDFSFLLYLAHKCGTGLWITEDGKVSFGTINNKKSLSDSETQYQNAILEKTVSANKSGRQIDILTMQHLPNGSLLNNMQSEYTICETYVHEKCDEPHFRYIGFTNPLFEESSYNPKYLFTTAKVTGNKDPENLGRIQVEFSEFTDNDSEKTWINFTSPFVGTNNGGCVYIPDVDDMVFVCISNGKAYALNAIRVNALPENCQDIQKKHFAIKDSIISIDENEILAKQGEKTSYLINADSIVSKHDKAKISLDDSSVTNQFDKSNVILNDSSVTNQIDKSKMVLKSDSIKSETGKSTLELKSDEIKSENGKGKISIKNGTSVLSGGKSTISLKNGKTKLTGSSIDLST
jgi:hypothetical protein